MSKVLDYNAKDFFLSNCTGRNTVAEWVFVLSTLIIQLFSIFSYFFVAFQHYWPPKINPFQRSTDKSCVSELSASEVEHLLRSASAHHQSKTPNYQQNHNARSTLYRHHQDGLHVRHQRGPFGFTTNNAADKDFGYKEASHRRPQDQNNFHHQDFGRYTDDRGSYHLTNCVNEYRSASKCNNGLNRKNGETNVSANGYPAPKAYDPKGSYPCQAELCYTPQNDIPLRDYISVDDRELYYSDSPSALSHDGTPATALYSSVTLCHRVPSPLFGDDVPYTILNSVSTTEPITAIFMGFQTTQDDSGQVQEDFQGSLKAELVVIDEDDKKGLNCPTGRAASGDRPSGKGMGMGMRRMRSKHKACCAVCWRCVAPECISVTKLTRRVTLPNWLQKNLAKSGVFLCL